ncbi:hypothetical protein LCGC14_2687920, partial [marine sediment metagenome]
MDYKTQLHIQEQVNRIKLVIYQALPSNMDVAAFIIALAELQREMAVLLYKNEDEE